MSNKTQIRPEWIPEAYRDEKTVPTAHKPALKSAVAANGLKRVEKKGWQAKKS